MDRELFNAKKKMSKMDNPNDASWAQDVSFSTLEKKITDSKKATEFALRPLSDNGSFRSGKSRTKTKEKAGKEAQAQAFDYSSIKKGRRAFLIFLAVWCTILITGIAIFLIRFNAFLTDYEAVYQASLPFHTMDDIMAAFNSRDAAKIYGLISEKPEITNFESEENVENYISKLIGEKELAYTEAKESSDKNPVYYVTADNYIVATVYLKMSDGKRDHDLPIYETDKIEVYTEPEWNVKIKAADNCKIYVNDVELSKDYVYRTEESEEKHFADFTTLPSTKYYEVDNLYEQPSVRAVNSFGLEVEPELNSSTGVYEVPFLVDKDTENEMIEFAKHAVDVYTKVVCRELGDNSLDAVFTKDNLIVKEIKSNRSSLAYFPRHTTPEVEDKILEFIPYSEDAFFCDIEHTQHMLIYGVRPQDYVTNARFYYYKENGSWKVCALVY